MRVEEACNLVFGALVYSEASPELAEKNMAAYRLMRDYAEKLEDIMRVPSYSTEDILESLNSHAHGKCNVWTSLELSLDGGTEQIMFSPTTDPVLTLDNAIAVVEGYRIQDILADLSGTVRTDDVDTLDALMEVPVTGEVLAMMNAANGPAIIEASTAVEAAVHYGSIFTYCGACDSTLDTGTEQCPGCGVALRW